MYVCNNKNKIKNLFCLNIFLLWYIVLPDIFRSKHSTKCSIQSGREVHFDEVKRGEREMKAKTGEDGGCISK